MDHLDRHGTAARHRSPGSTRDVGADCARLVGELGDQVIRDLFATGLVLHSVAAALGPGPEADRLRTAAAGLDGTIDGVRRTALALSVDPASTGGGVAWLLETVAELTPALGVLPVTRLVGPVGELPPDLVTDLREVLREALTDVARHASARGVETELAVVGGRVTLQVTLQVNDDGVGCAGPPRDGGLTGLRRRAHRHGGELALAPRTGGGTRLIWAVPLRSPGDLGPLAVPDGVVTVEG